MDQNDRQTSARGTGSGQQNPSGAFRPSGSGQASDPYQTWQPAGQGWPPIAGPQRQNPPYAPAQGGQTHGQPWPGQPGQQPANPQWQAPAGQQGTWPGQPQAAGQQWQGQSPWPSGQWQQAPTPTGSNGGISGLSGGRPTPPTVRKRHGPVWPSLLLGLLALILGAIAVVLYIRQQEEPQPVAPTALPAQNGLAQVVNALNGAGLKTDYQTTSVRYGDLNEVGQAITIDGHAAWVFIYSSEKDQEAATEAFNKGNQKPVISPSGRQLTQKPPVMYSHSNVLILVSVDQNPSDEELAKIEKAVDALP